MPYLVTFTFTYTSIDTILTYILFSFVFYSSRLQKLNKEQERSVKSKEEHIKVVESELKAKQKTIDQQKQKILELTELLNRHLLDQTKPDVKHRMGEY